MVLEGMRLQNKKVYSDGNPTNDIRGMICSLYGSGASNLMRVCILDHFWETTVLPYFRQTSAFIN